jgi:hypothetical protein
MSFGARVIGVDKERNEVRARHHLAHHVETLTPESACDQTDPGRVALGSVEACDEPGAYRIRFAPKWSPMPATPFPQRGHWDSAVPIDIPSY